MGKEKISTQELIVKSIQIFRKKGYYRTSMADLAAACELTKGAFYHHYKNKEEVMMSCLISTSKLFEEKVFAIAFNKEYKAKEQLIKMTDITFYAFTKESGGCYFANTVLETVHIEDTFIEVLKNFFLNWKNAMMEIFSSKYNNKEAEELSVKSINDIEGAIILMQLHDDTSYLRDALKRCVESY